MLSLLVIVVVIAREGVDIHKVVHCLACTVDIIFGDNHVNDDEDHDYGDYDDDDDDVDDNLVVVVVLRLDGSQSSSCQVTHCNDSVPANSI